MERIEEWKLKQRQALPLSVKVKLTEQRIRSWYEEFDRNVYVSFSGGKDSTVLLDIARKYDANIKAVYLDTWMEYPQVRQFVKSYDNVIRIKPEKSMKQIIEEDGWCFPSKDVAEMIDAVRRDKPWAIRKINGLDKDGNKSEYRQQYTKWKNLVDAPFNISHRCCLDMKEFPVQKYERKTGLKPIVALMADESARRKEAYMRTGCNSFDGARPISKPMGFWSEQDVLQYIKKNNLPIASVYGSICQQNEIGGQLSIECENCKLMTTGERRTGCIFCTVGCHLDNFAKLKRLKQTNRNLYDYFMDEMGLRDVCSWIDRNVVKGANKF